MSESYPSGANMFISTLSTEASAIELAEDIYLEIQKRYKKEIGQMQLQMHSMLQDIDKVNRKLNEVRLMIQMMGK